jgi:type II secretory pathway pseudopilin PulG
MRRTTLLIVLGIVATSAGFLGPAVQLLRERRDRAECVNNLRQIGLALHHYHDESQCYPPATVPNPTLPPERRLSWVVPLLPVIECGSPYHLMEKDKAWDDEANADPVRVRFRIFLRPMNPNQGDPSAPALTHYAGIGTIRLPATSGEEETRAGLFGLDPSKHRLIAEGANDDTVVVIETTIRNGPGRGRRAALRRCGTSTFPAALRMTCSGATTTKRLSGFSVRGLSTA